MCTDVVVKASERWVKALRSSDKGPDLQRLYILIFRCASLTTPRTQQVDVKPLTDSVLHLPATIQGQLWLKVDLLFIWNSSTGIMSR